MVNSNAVGKDVYKRQEDGLIRFVTEKFDEQRDYYTSLDARYDGHKIGRAHV